MDYSKLSDEELDRIIESGQPFPEPAPGQGLDAAKRRAAAVQRVDEARNPAPVAEQIEPSAIKRGMAAFGGSLQEPFVSGLEKLKLAFPGEGEAGAARVAEIGAERSGRREALRQLKETPAGEFGAFAGEVAPAVLASPTIPAQVATAGLLGFLRGGADKPKGFGSEVASSAASGAIDAATTGLLLKGADLFGHTVNAARGKFTPEGLKMLELDEAAKRMGLKGEHALSIGQLDPNSPAGVIEKNLPGYAKRVERQADVVRGNLDARRTVPSPMGGTEEQLVPGGQLTEELQKAVRERYAQARDMYTAVDDFAAAKGLGNVTPVYSVPQLLSLQKNAVKGDEASLLAATMVNNYDPKALEWIGNALQSGLSQKEIKAAGIPMTTYHDMRVAVNKAISTLDRVNPANKTATQTRAQQLLQDLREGLDNEVERWASSNAGNREAVDLYNRAKEFYATTVAPAVVSNPLARKVASRQKGFNTAESLYSALQAPQNQELIDRLLPTVSPGGLDALLTIRGLPDIGKTLASRQPPTQTGRGGLSALAGAALGHPSAALTEMAPGLSWLGRTGTGKRLYASESPLKGALGRAVAGAVQYPQEDLGSSARKTLGLK